jgi:hypothetical protein
MSLMAGRAVFCCGWMQCTFLPILRHPTVTIKAEPRLTLALVTGMGRTMATVTRHALHFGDRFMGDFVPSHFGLNLSMAVKTDLAGFVLDQIVLIASMSPVTKKALTFSKRRMC